MRLPVRFILSSLLLWQLSPANAAICDTDADNDVDRNDVTQILQGRNNPAADSNDPRDANGDGFIDVLDARACVLRCDLPRCAIIVPPNQAPVVDAGPDATIDEGGTFSGSGSFSDADSGSWSATVDYGEGAGPQPLALNPNKTFALLHLYFDDGVYTVTVAVSDDDGAVGVDTVEVTVNRTDPAPEITSAPATNATEAMLYKYTVEADDIDGDVLTYRLLLGPTGMGIDSATGMIYWTPSTAQVGSHEVLVQVHDPAGLFDTQYYNVEVDPAAETPLLELAFVDSFELIWSNYGSHGNYEASFFKPVIPPHLAVEGFHALGHFGQPGLIAMPNGYMLVARELASGILVKPERYVRVWSSAGLDSDLPATFWKPVAPPGYHCLGLLVKTGAGLQTPPATSEIRCVSETVTMQNTLAELADNKYEVDLVWDTDGSFADVKFTATQIMPNKDYRLTTPSNAVAIHVGTFTGSSLSNPFQDMELTSWIDKRYVLQRGIDHAAVTGLINAHAPFIWLHPQELFFPDDPSFVLDAVPSNLCWGLLLNESEPSDYEITNWGCVETSSASLLADYQANVVANPLSSDPLTWLLFRHWIEIPDIWAPGSLSRAKALVNVIPVDAVFTDIQFWVFYPFNGPARVKVCPLGLNPCSDHHLDENGRHYGDWEHVTLRFLNRKNASSEHELVGVYMSRHDKGQWFSRKYFNQTIQVINGYPVVYSGKFSHAFYPSINDRYIYNITNDFFATVSLYDETGPGYPFPTINNYEIVNAGIQGFLTEDRPWLKFSGRWGQYLYNYDLLMVPVITPQTLLFPYPQKELGTGPTGMNLKYEFNYGDGNDWFWFPTIK